MLRGPNLMLGYLDDSAVTGAAIDGDGWLHTGDAGRLEPGGYLAITGRIKDMYICGGFNVYPAEVEQVLGRLDGVAESVVIGVPDPRLGEVGRAFLVTRPVGGDAWQLDGEGAGVLDGEGAGVLDGEGAGVLDGEGAGVLLAAARGPAGVGLFEVDPGQDGVSRTARTTMDLTRELAVVRLNRARDLACLALSAEQAGAARRALELTVGYTLTRLQFGRVIGSFQALQHRLADLHVLVESAVSLSRACACGDTPALGLRASAAKIYCAEALMRTAAEMIQLHGAIGITWEHPAHRYLKRAHGGLHLFGRPARHAAAVAAVAASLIDR